MAIPRTSLLDLPLPVTGSLSGDWGAATNNGLTEYLDIAVAGSLVLNTDADVTLTSTDGDENGTNIGSTTAQYAILRWTATGSTTRNITVPAKSKTYIVINATGGTQSIVLRGAGPTTGVTIVSGERAVCAWNGSDFVKVGGAAGGTNTQVQYNNAGVFGGITNATTDGTTLSMTSPEVITGINDTNGAELLKVTATASAVNELTLANAATGNAPTLSATGDDTNIGINITPKGTGVVTISNLAATTIDTTNIEVTNIKAKDGTAAASIADSTGAITVSTLLNVDNLRLDGNTLSSTDSGGNIVLAPNGTGDVQLDADTVRIGDSNANATLTTNGAGDLILSTNSGTNSGTITIQDGVNGNIILTPNGTGAVQETVSSTNYNIVSQADIGTAPNEIPLNQYLGDLAYQDSTAVTVGSLTASGNIILSTAGAGIDFSATANSSGTMTSELLSDYEEGTWTPVIRGSGTAGTYELALNRTTYTKIGRQVTLEAVILLASSVTGGGTGYLQITGAPFAHVALTTSNGNGALSTDMAKSAGTLWAVVQFASTSILYFQESGATTLTDFPVSSAVANKSIYFTYTYFTS
jgi:hypothetical protein